MENLHRSDLAVRQDLLSVSHSTRDESTTKFAAGFLKLGIITARETWKTVFPVLAREDSGNRIRRTSLVVVGHTPFVVRRSPNQDECTQRSARD
jgi:hypothetical protein